MLDQPSKTEKETRVTVLRKFHDFLDSAKAEERRIVTLYGGAASGKSHSIMQWLLKLGLQYNDLDILVFRKTTPYVRMSCWTYMRRMLHEWGVPFYENKTELYIDLPSGSTLWYKGMDDPEKIKSINASIIWMEEATEFSWNEFTQLNLRCRKPCSIQNQMILSFNPIDAYHWCMQKIVDRVRADDGIAVMHSTYRDNPFADAKYVRDLKSLEETNPNYYRIYALGEPGVLEHVIYSNNWVEEDTMAWPQQTRIDPPEAYGVDIGYTDPMVVLAIWYVDGEYYIRQLLYQRGWTLRRLVDWAAGERVEGRLHAGSTFYVDPSQPGAIDELCRIGLNAMPAVNAIGDGINFVKSHKLHIDQFAVDVIKEIRGYSYQKDRDGHVYDKPAPKQNDHAMDCLRYGIYTYQHSLTDYGGEEKLYDEMDWDMDEKRKVPTLYRGDVPSIYTGGI